MQLYLLRHAEAVPDAESDEARALTEKGIEQAKRVGRFCAENGLEPDVILSSHYVRAMQTARQVAKRLEKGDPIGVPFLTAGMKPEVAIEQLHHYRDAGSVMLVGHEPDFSRLAARLIGLDDPHRLHLRKACLLMFE